MNRVFLDMTVSLDGFAAGPDISHQHPLGRDGMMLHAWLFGRDDAPPGEADRLAAQAMFAETGAFIIGRRTYDVGISEWGDDGAFGVPCFVITHRPRQQHILGPTAFNFIDGDPEYVLAMAKQAAGDKDVCVMGGASTARQFIQRNLLDELRIHIAPVLLGRGTRLFDTLPGSIALRPLTAASTPLATHLRFER